MGACWFLGSTVECVRWDNGWLGGVSPVQPHLLHPPAKTTTSPEPVTEKGITLIGQGGN